MDRRITYEITVDCQMTVPVIVKAKNHNEARKKAHAIGLRCVKSKKNWKFRFDNEYDSTRIGRTYGKQ